MGQCVRVETPWLYDAAQGLWVDRPVHSIGPEPELPDSLRALQPDTDHPRGEHGGFQTEELIQIWLTCVQAA